MTLWACERTASGKNESGPGSLVGPVMHPARCESCAGTHSTKQSAAPLEQSLSILAPGFSDQPTLTNSNCFAALTIGGRFSTARSGSMFTETTEWLSG